MNYHTSIKDQQGVVIVIALVTLLVMTMVGLTSIGNATLQERMAANNRFYLQSRLNAETALREAEDFLSGRIVATPVSIDKEEQVSALFAQSDTDHLYLNVKVAQDSAETLQTPTQDINLSLQSNWDASSLTSQEVEISDVANSRYIIEYIGQVDYRALVGNDRVDLSGPDFESQKPAAFRITAIGYSSNANIYSVLESIYATASGDSAP